MSIPQGPNQRWSLDFLSDQLSDGRRFRILAVVDDFDLPLKFHPAAIRASAVDTPFGSG